MGVIFVFYIKKICRQTSQKKSIDPRNAIIKKIDEMNNNNKKKKKKK